LTLVYEFVSKSQTTQSDAGMHYFFRASHSFMIVILY